MGADLAAKLRPLNDVIFWSVPLGAIGHSPRALRELGRSAVAPSPRFIDSPRERTVPPSAATFAKLDLVEYWT